MPPNNPDPIDALADAAEAGERLRNDPEAMRKRVTELEDKEREKAKKEVREAMAEAPDAFHDALDRRDPQVTSRVNRALGH